MPQFVKHFVQDLTQDIKIRQCGTIVFNADDEANVITIDLYNGEEPATLTGSVVGAVICSDGSTVPVTGGTISGNTVTLTLTGDCGAIPGPIGVGVQIVNGTQKTTVLKAVYNVELFTTDTVVDPGSRITITVSDLVQDIADAVATIPADYTDLLAAVAPNYSGLTFPVKAGTLCWYNGALYQARQDIATSESWTAAHWASAVLSTSVDGKIADVQEEVSSLKRALNAEKVLKQTALTYAQGSYSSTSSSAVSSSKLIRTNNYMPSEIVGVQVPDGFYARVFAYNGTTYVGRWTNVGFSKSSAGTVVTIDLTGDIIFSELSATIYTYKIVIGKISGDEIVPSEASAVKYYYNADDTLSVSGKAADAKATADAINDVSLQINGAQGTVTEIVTVDMTRAQLAAACDAQREAYTALCLCNTKSFYSLASASTLEEAYERLNRYFRREVYVPGMTKKTVIDRINRAFTEPIHRFEDARLNLDTPCDFSVKFTAKSGEPSLIVSEDGGELWVYGYSKRFKTRDGMSWTMESITLSNGGAFGHAGLSVIDGTIYMIARDYRNNNDLIMYTSPFSDGLNFTYQGVVLEKGHNFGDGLTISNWGNSCMCKINGTYYLYIEGKDSENRNFWDTYLVTCTDPLEAQQGGTIGDWTNSSVAPIISGATLHPGVGSLVSVGNPDFAKGPDNRPIRDADGKWYMYVHSTANSYMYIHRLSSADLVNWSNDGIMYDNRIKPTAGQNQSSNADQAIIEFKGRTYFFYTTDINTELDPHLAYMIDDRPIREILAMRP